MVLKMKKTNTLKICFYLPWLFAHSSSATDNVMINIPKQTVAHYESSRKNEELFSHVINFNSVCTTPCKKIEVTWTPLSEQLNLQESDSTYLFSSGVKGVGILFKPLDNSNIANAQLKISVIKTENTIGSGELISTLLLRRNVKYIDENNSILKTESENFSVNGSVASGGCVIPHGQNLNITLPPVTQAQVMGVSPGQKLTGSAGQTSLNLHCDPGVAKEIRLFFKSLTSGNNIVGPSILPAVNDSGERSGIGFVMIVNNKQVMWDGTTPISIQPDKTSGTVDIPFRAYYTRTGDEVSIGNIEAVAAVIIKYR